MDGGLPTFRRAARLVTVREGVETTTSYLPLCVAWTLVRVRVFANASGRFSPLNRHWYRRALPVASTLKRTVAPGTTVWSFGPPRMTGSAPGANAAPGLGVAATQF